MARYIILMVEGSTVDLNKEKCHISYISNLAAHDSTENQQNVTEYSC